MIEDKSPHAAVISRRLKKAYPDARSELDYTTPFELTIGSILATQNTDKNVNTVTPELFRKYPNPADYVKVPQEEREIVERRCVGPIQFTVSEMPSAENRLSVR